MIADKPITLLCTYPLTLSKAGDAFDVVRAHQFAIAKHRDEWEVIAAPAVSRDKHLEAVDAATRVSALSLRERQVLDAIIGGSPNKMVAHDLEIDVRTVETHRARLMRGSGLASAPWRKRCGWGPWRNLLRRRYHLNHRALVCPGLRRQRWGGGSVFPWRIAPSSGQGQAASKPSRPEGGAVSCA